MIKLAVATPRDAARLARLHIAVARDLTTKHGRGHWSHEPTEARVLRAMTMARIIVAKDGRSVVGTFHLGTRKPWAIDPAFFTAVKRPLYLTDMAVDPMRQSEGIGRALMEKAAQVARAWPAEAIRLDAYSGPAGAGGFYKKCGLAERGRVVYRGVPLIYFERVVAVSSAETSSRSR
ncbi:MAG TPA: GNAT family N-acetyltransferase [Candidatus Polarisedimenticolaceae bacterium]|nr:GNAT family N-acetyltransferase [Candidatus Polarisedimenticolaceae bacterium]